MEAIGNLGVPALATNRFYIGIVNVGLSLVTFVFYCVALAGCSTDEEAVKNGAWIEKGQGGDIVTYFGTMMAATFDDDKKQGSGTEYADKSCGGTLCDTCEDSGNSATAFTVIGFCLVIPVFIISFLRMTAEKDSAMVKVAAVVCAALSLVFVIIALSSFSECYDKIEDVMTDKDLSYGTAFNLMGINILTLFLAFVFHLLTPA
eukprot:316827_1